MHFQKLHHVLNELRFFQSLIPIKVLFYKKKVFFYDFLLINYDDYDYDQHFLLGAQQLQSNFLSHFFANFPHKALVTAQ